MLLKRMNDPRTGSRTKIIFNQGEDEFDDLRELFERTFPGGNAQLENEYQKVMNELETYYAKEDPHEEKYPSTSLADSSLSYVLPLFFTAMEQKAPEPQKVDRRKYIELEKYNSLMVEYDKATSYVQNLQSQINNPQIAEELTKYKSELDAWKTSATELKKELKSVEDCRVEALRNLASSFEREELSNQLNECLKDYVASNTTDNRNDAISNMNALIVQEVKDLLSSHSKNEEVLNQTTTELEELRSKNTEICKKIDSMAIQYAKFQKSLHLMHPAIEEIRKGADFLTTNFCENEGTTI